MDGRLGRAIGFALCGLVGCAELAPPPSSTLTADKHEAVDSGWPGWSDWSNKSVNMMIEKYGSPDSIETGRVVWNKKGPWKRIAVWDGLGFGDNGVGDSNLEETITYPVPADKVKALSQFTQTVHASSENAELSARSRSEERNYLMLNLADEIIQGHRDPLDARRFYDHEVRLEAAGKSSPYMSGLIFQIPSAN